MATEQFSDDLTDPSGWTEEKRSRAMTNDEIMARTKANSAAAMAEYNREEAEFAGLMEAALASLVNDMRAFQMTFKDEGALNQVADGAEVHRVLHDHLKGAKVRLESILLMEKAWMELRGSEWLEP
jgi:hypothetical protein